MIKIKFHCPKCQNTLENNFVCSICNKKDFEKRGYFDFLEKDYERENSTTAKILNYIKSKSYSDGVREFLKENSEYEYRFNKMEGSIGFRATTRNNAKCLVINSDFGNIPEFLSDIYDEVYSLELDLGKIHIQKNRFDSKNIKNIILFRAELHKLPFDEEFFDLIVSDGINVDEDNKIIKNNIDEVKRILEKCGCYCLCVPNKTKLRYFKNKNTNKNNNFLYENFHGYIAILNPFWKVIKPYWVLPSHKMPHHSGEINNNSSKWFIENFDKNFSVDKKWKFAGKILKNFPLKSYFVKSIFPSFIFYCYKEKLPLTIEEKIKSETNFKTIIQNSRLHKVNYILIDDFGEAKKIVSCKISKYNLLEKIIQVKRIFPHMKDPDEKMIIDDWMQGEFLDSSNEDDVKLTLEWLKEFQNETRTDWLDFEEIQKEVDRIKTKLITYESISMLPYRKWLEEYSQHMKNIKLKKTGVHGDFQIQNIILNKERKTLNIIDWDCRFEEEGNPIYDFIWLMINLIGNLNYKNNEFTQLIITNENYSTINLIMETMRNHFQINFDFVVLIRFMILRFITFKNPNDLGILYYVKLLKSIKK
jgi:ubiquinone/menaquinone biosynthesis C-methylase UbiE